MKISSIGLTKAHILCALVFLFFQGNAQRNLVPNPSFELLSVNCDSIVSGGGGAKYWYSTLINSPTYTVANTCAKNTCCKIPYLTGGQDYQLPHSGNGFAGIVTYFIFSPTAKNNSRDYLRTKLLDTLKKDKMYYVECFVNNEDIYKFGINNLGLYLSDTALNNMKFNLNKLRPQIQQFGNPIIFDTANWVKIAGLYKAHGGEQFITFGNFRNDTETDTISNNTSITGAAYGIDDVSVIPLDSLVLKADAGRDTTIYKGDSAWIGSRISGITDMHWRTAAGGVVADSVPCLWVKPTTTTTYILDQTIGGQYSKDTVKVTVVQPVPVLVVSGQLLVVREGKAVEFSWQTANEINLSHFVVEQSPDGLEYQAAGIVKANGTGANKYAYVVPLSFGEGLGVRFFRLKMVDKDGRYSYSKLYSVQFSMLHTPLSIIPNPAKDQITITGKNLQRYQIIDNLGRVLLDTKATEGVHTLDVSGLSKGVYLVKGYSAEGNVVTGKFLKE